MIIMRTMSDQKTGAYQPNCFNCGNSESMLGNGDLTGPNAMKRKKSRANSEVAGHDELSRDHSESQSFCRMTSSTIQSTALAHFLKKVFEMSKSNGIRVFLVGRGKTLQLMGKARGQYPCESRQHIAAKLHRSNVRPTKRREKTTKGLGVPLRGFFVSPRADFNRVYGGANRCSRLRRRQ